MLDVAEYLVGAALVTIGYLTGALATRKARPKSTLPVCPCTHSIGHHENQTGRCTAQVARVHYLRSGDRNGKEYVPCGCLRYSGPELLSNFMVRELKDE